MKAIDLTLQLEYAGDDTETLQAMALARHLKDCCLQLVSKLEATAGDEVGSLRVARELDRTYHQFDIEAKFAFGLIMDQRYCNDE